MVDGGSPDIAPLAEQIPQHVREAAKADYKAALSLTMPQKTGLETLSLSPNTLDIVRRVHKDMPTVFAKERTIAVPILPVSLKELEAARTIDEREMLEAKVGSLVRKANGGEIESNTEFIDVSLGGAAMDIMKYVSDKWAIEYPNLSHDDQRGARVNLHNVTAGQSGGGDVVSGNEEERLRYEHDFHDRNQFRGRNGIQKVMGAFGLASMALKSINPGLSEYLSDQDNKIFALTLGIDGQKKYDDMDIEEKLAVVRVVIDTGAESLKRMFGDTVEYNQNFKTT